MKAELRELKGAIASATDPAQMSALAQQAGKVSDKIKDANDAVAVFATGSKFEQVSNGLGGIKDSLMSLDFEEAAEKSKTFSKALGGINPKDIGKAMTGLVTTVGTLGKAFLKLGAQLLVNPIFLMVAIVVAVVLAFTIWEDKLGKFGTVLKVVFINIYLMVQAVKILIQGFKDLTDWLGLTSFAAEENAEKTAAANKKVTDSSKEREAQILGDLGREIAERKAAGEDTTKLEEQVSNTKIKEANKRKIEAKKELDSIKNLDSKFYNDKRIELKKQITEENNIIKQGYSDKIVAKNTANKKEADDEDKKQAEAAAKQKAANEKYAAADKASMEQIAAAKKIVTDSAKTAQQVELDDLAAAYKIKIAEAVKYKNSTTALLDAQKIQEAEINKKYADAAKAITDADNLKRIADEDAVFLETQRLLLNDTEFKKLQATQAAEAKMNQFSSNAEIVKGLEKELAQQILDIDKEAQEKKTAKLKEEKDKQDKIIEESRQKELAAIKGGLDTATDALNGINSLTNIGMEAKLKNVKKGSKEEEKILRAQFKQQKAMQLAMAVINGAQSILAITSVPDFTLGVATAIRIGASVAATAASIATISSTQFGGGGSAPTTPDVGAGASTTAVAPASGPSLFGNANTGSQVNAGGGTPNNITVTAVVSETEITASQNHINNIQQNSVL
jgi:hypothetical protein